MTGAEVLSSDRPDYSYGNGGEMLVNNMASNQAGDFEVTPLTLPIDEYRTWGLDEDELGSPTFNVAYKEKLVEIADNLRLVEDPVSGRTFEITVANEDALLEDTGAVVQISTSGSTIPDNPSNAVELAQNALANPGQAIIYIASPGNGGSTALTEDELKIATKTGRLVDNRIQGNGGWEAFPTIQAMARALGTLDGKVTHLSSDASGAHYASALMSALPEKQVERAFFYNPTNISNLSLPGYLWRMGREIFTQGNYRKMTKDPMAVTEVRRERAIEIMGKGFGSKVTQMRSGTFGPRKMHNEAQIYRRGHTNRNDAAHHHITTGLWRQPDAKVTYVFPEFSAHYKGKDDIYRFMESVYHIGNLLTGSARVEGNSIPVGQYWHSHHPMARLALQYSAFTR